MSRIACTVRPWTKLPLARALTGIARSGFDAVALPVHGVEEVLTPASTADEAAAIRDEIAGHGLDLVVLSHAAALDGTDAEALTALRAQLTHCAQLGVDTLVDMGTTVPEHYDRYIALMRAGARIAHDLGVRIAVKPHGGLTRTCADLLSVLERVDHPAYRVCLDPGNLVHHAGAAPVDDMASVAPYVIAVGVRDHPGRGRPGGDDGGMPPPITPGDGTVDLHGMYTALRRHGFDGPSAVESLTPQPTPERIDTEAARARDTVTALLTDTPAPPPAPRERITCAGIATGTDEPLAGTARSFDRYLLVEIPLPWPPGMGRPLAEYPQVPATLRAPLSRFDAAATAAGLTAKTLALAPDPDYSVAGHTRVMHYTRPHGPAAGYHRDEYVVPDATAPALIDAIATGDPRELSAFAEYRHDNPHRRDLVICTHASVDACCGRLGYPLYHALRERLGAEHPVRVWRISSFGGHRFAPVAIDLPEGRFWGRLTPDIAVQLADRTGDPTEIIHHYRGWGLLDTTAAQIVEHQMLAEQGWSWIGRPTHATVREHEHEHEHDERTTVRIEARTDPDDHHPSVWEASVEAATTDEVLVGCVGPFGAIQRYRITNLTRQGRLTSTLQEARA